MNTKRLLSAVVFLVTAAMLTPHDTSAQLDVRVSVKLLYDNSVSPPMPPGGYTNGSGGIDPSHCGNFTDSAISCEAEILEKFDYVNMLMDRFGRGYRFEPIEIVHLTNPPAIPAGELTNETTRVWTLARPGSDTEHLLSVEAKADTNYAYRADAINFYVFNASGGGYADNEFYSANNDICTTSQGEDGSWPRFLHEMGHYLGLYHTFGTGGTNPIPSDSVCDTLLDESRSSLDDIATNNFGTNFTALTCEQQEQVYDVFYNVMSYNADDGYIADPGSFDIDSVVCSTNLPNTSGHIRHRLTIDQLDRISNRLNNLATIGVVNGRTVFVSPSHSPCDSVENTAPNNCPCDQAPRNINGFSIPPESTIAAGLFLTGTDTTEDILLIRGGDYNETGVIDQRVTLRATRGDVFIGR